MKEEEEEFVRKGYVEGGQKIVEDGWGTRNIFQVLSVFPFFDFFCISFRRLRALWSIPFSIFFFLNNGLLILWMTENEFGNVRLVSWLSAGRDLQFV